MKELELSEIFEKIIIQAFQITISVLGFKSNLFIELNLIPITARLHRCSVVVLFCLVSHVISRNYLQFLFLLLWKPTYFGQTNRKLI